MISLGRQFPTSRILSASMQRLLTTSLLRQLHVQNEASAAGSRAFTYSVSSLKPLQTSKSSAPVSSVTQVTSPDADFAAIELRSSIKKYNNSQQEESSSLLEPRMFRRQRRERKKEQRKAALRRKESQTIFGKAGLSRKSLSPFVRIDSQFKTFKPLTPSLRWVRQAVNPHLYRGPPEPSLTRAKRRTGGRNHHGHVTVRGRGGGSKTRTRLVDFLRWETGLQTVLRIERDPGRSAHIALIEHNETKTKSYILAPDGMRSGDTVESYRQGIPDEDGKSIESSSLNLGIFRTKAVRPGNVLPLRLIPIGTTVHALSLLPNGSAKLVRSAGSYGQVVAFVNRSKATPSASVSEEALSPSNQMPGGASDATSGPQGTPSTTHAQIRLQSGEVRLLPINCCATIGRVSNVDHEHERLGKAGRSRWLGRRPKVRGVAMNAVDHPHGGGRGKSKGNKHPRSIYGQKVKGPRTRKPGTAGGNRMVVRERPRRNGKRAGKA